MGNFLRPLHYAAPPGHEDLDVPTFCIYGKETLSPQPETSGVLGPPKRILGRSLNGILRRFQKVRLADGAVLRIHLQPKWVLGFRVQGY